MVHKGSIAAGEHHTRAVADKGKLQAGEGQPDRKDPAVVGTVREPGQEPAHRVTGVHTGLHRFVGSP